MKHIVFAIGSLHGGGAERVVSVWASALAEKGYRVSVLVYSRLENEYPVDSRVAICPIAPSIEECNQMSMIQRLKCFRRELKRLKPDAIISFLPVVQVYIALASIGLRIPRIETIRINPWITDFVKIKLKKVWLWCYKTCHSLILQSEDQRSFFSPSVQKKAVVIPNPINSLYIENRKTEYHANSHKIVAAGRLSDQKNYKMMIDAMKLISQDYEDLSLQIYGNGELENTLRSYVEEQGLNGKVILMGRSNELYKVYQDADIYVMSSDYEGMPNALAEAMAIGLPCISTDCKTGPRDLINDGENGFLIPCGDAEALAEKIRHIFSMTDEEQRILGENARKKIINFCSEENSLNKLINLIENL